MKKLFVLSLLTLLILAGSGFAQEETSVFVAGNPLPDAPELAYRGDYDVGVRTITVTDSDRIDANAEDYPDTLYDRELTLHIWYPAVITAATAGIASYDDVLVDFWTREDVQAFSFDGRAYRNAGTLIGDQPYPLLIVSHGYPGTGVEQTYLTENLASKGYVVVAIDHNEPPESGQFNTNIPLLNRAFDIEFVLDEIAELNESDDVFQGVVDIDNTALIGYSMGGYGVLNMLGAGYNPLLRLTLGAPIAPRLQGTLTDVDERIKAAVLIAPYGGDLSNAGVNLSMWTPGAMETIGVPTFWIVGTNDRVAVTDAVVRLFDQSINSERYLLTLREAGHNIGTNSPPPQATTLGTYDRYSDAVWDKRRVNNIHQHFITAFLGYYLKGDTSYLPYLDLEVEVSNEGVYSVDENGDPTEEHTYWTGFLRNTAWGMELRAGTP